ncbi:molybdopterin converting factor subunit 1 [Cellulophaga sp. F20128]|uniref:molybdopterin converting factor subunit 1 n=1 Tax=Cellulophaga sp. F20128 TaxID=2926413 RepID=UPI001FF31DCE|nr:molybdopterin converting factor subunit 1 [Cellulophaga sp. F20128]MCK0158167.1 molybdopterin converting factor subunit 1 [Cellulophaga sp. F20128]
MTVLLFGVTKDIIGKNTLMLSDIVKDKLKTVQDLKMYLTQEYPNLENLSSLAIAVNNEYADDSLLLKQTDEIALIPPVSGG